MGISSSEAIAPTKSDSAFTPAGINVQTVTRTAKANAKSAVDVDGRIIQFCCCELFNWTSRTRIKL